jgi:hypothetical protein
MRADGWYTCSTIQEHFIRSLETSMTIAGLDVSELIALALLLVAVGTLSGFLAGVFGIGGGAGARTGVL